MTSAERRAELQQRFCTLLNEKAQADEMARLAHNEMMRIQGALAELDRLSQPGESPGAG